jgi:probable HAF family extracellular repeat protein
MIAAELLLRLPRIEEDMKPKHRLFFVAFCLALSISATLHAENQPFATIDFPKAASTQTWGINSRGDVVGFYVTADKVTHGFLKSEGRFTTIDFPGASSTLANGINSLGDIVAEYTLAGTLHGLLLSGINLSPIEFPGATGTEPLGINARGDIVGDYVSADKVTHGFLLVGDRFTTIDFSGATLTLPQSINPRGDIVGGYRDAGGSSHGFVLSDGNFTSFDFPGATFTTATGISPRGDIVGRYTAGGVNHGYLLSGGQFTTIDYPGATFTGATAIDPRGDILGRCIIAGVSHGFLLSSQGTYTITDLGIVGLTPGQAFFVTKNGLVSAAGAGSDKAQHAFLWYKGLTTDISQPGLGGKNSVAFGASAIGQAIGEAETATADPDREDFCGFKALGLPTSGASCMPYLWQYGVMNPLPTLGGNNGAANGINAQGAIAGVAENSSVDKTCPAPQVHQFKPVIWDGEGVHELPTVAGDQHGVAFAINDSGAAVGASGDCSEFSQTLLVNLQPLHALLWEAGTVTDLGSLGGTGHGSGIIALNLNNLGQVVGASDLPGDTTSHAFLWTRDKGMQDLGTLPGDVISAGLAINDSSEIVGVSLDANFNLRAYHWQDGVMSDLNDLAPNSPLYLLLACSINARGEITGLAIDNTSGEFHAYVAVPSNSAAAVGNVTGAASSPLLKEAAQNLPGRVRYRGAGARRLPVR